MLIPPFKFFFPNLLTKGQYFGAGSTLLETSWIPIRIEGAVLDPEGKKTEIKWVPEVKMKTDLEEQNQGVKQKNVKHAAAVLITIEMCHNICESFIEIILKIVGTV